MSSRPTIEEASELPIDALAIRILRYFEPLENNDDDISRRGIGNPGTWAKRDMPPDERERALRASVRALEAYDWLYLHGLVAPHQSATGFAETGYVTEKGRTLLARDDGLALLQAEERLNVNMHPIIAERVRHQFLLGEYELASLLAMKLVEVRVREIGVFGDDVIGVQLMRKAFSHEDGRLGPLADPAQEVAEREATAHLFAGAIGLFKNPVSHRQVNYSDPTVAAEIVLFADLLHRMLDAIETRIASTAPTS